MTFKPDTVEKLRNTIDSYTQRPDGIPGLVYVAVDRDGNNIFSHASGKRGVGMHQDMDLETSFWIASCTKLVTAIAAMQLVEQGRVDLDSEEDIQRLLPELSRLQVIVEETNGELRLVDQERKITLRMLLTHTAGFGYSFSNAKLKKWYDPVGIDEFDDQERDVYRQPLVHQPGSCWEYSVSIDWVGRIVERLSSLSLDDYCQRHIFGPLGVQKTTFRPTAEMRSKLACMHTRNDDGSIKLSEEGHLLRRPLKASAEEDTDGFLYSGGAGLFSNPVEFCKIIALLLNYGKDPLSSNRILREETVKEMLRNQIPQFPDFGRAQERPSKPSLMNHDSEFYPQSGDPPQGWGLSFFSLLQQGPSGQAVGTVLWSGLANLFWWADIENGIGGMLATQILPFGDLNVAQCQTEVENIIYSKFT
ncbi:hypothetical protein LB505_013192 [Fusarium chuoi]|nr:hypothetical protein LB505_013192 [Fusarium chuoi]